MRRLHCSVVRPLLEAVDAREILEVGADDGGHTDLLQACCREVGGRLTVVDPEPGERLHGVLDETVTTLHLVPSRDVLSTLPTPDVALIDGDHNYFTVQRELTALADRAAAGSRPLPLVLLHDVGWPWGRRDMYPCRSRVVPLEVRRPPGSCGAPRPTRRPGGRQEDRP